MLRQREGRSFRYQRFFKSNGVDVQNLFSSWIDDKEAAECCHWERVKCNALTGHVIELSLHELGIKVPTYDHLFFLNVSLFHPFQLINLDLSNNWFAGWIDDIQGFQSLRKLETLNFSYNKLDSNMLPTISTLTSLRTLNISGNNIEGSFLDLGTDFITLRKLKRLDLSYNQLMGGIFDEDFMIFRNLEMLDFSNNYLSGTLPMQGLCAMKNLHELDLSRNAFVGMVPECLGYLQHIHALNLSHNQLSGYITKSLSNLKQIESLDLSYNNLSGKIPTELTKLPIFNISNNIISSITSSTGNDEINNAATTTSTTTMDFPLVPFHEEGDEEESAIDMNWFIWSFVASYSVLLVGLVIILGINPHWRMAWFSFIDYCIYVCIPRYVFEKYFLRNIIL
ncbi:Leucine-rich repeat receptor-like protein kinase [Quillaja saponaria]|uniref:Leucine-rich repeat receptor-like protein kinase n=1 Tax=Quillaja saponaria TaxID=32244 RepID=A0AAD7LRN3_QUISA|nr:Leucine-rich repeat receptor-like protein kinase [Quillaja saponaria]